MIKSAIFILGLILLINCGGPREYKFSEEILLKGMNPISAAVNDEGFWVSDSKNNRVIKIDEKGEILKSYEGFQRPMHIAIFDNKVYVPEYLTDAVSVITKGRKGSLELKIKPNAPGGIDVNGSLIAIADFYNHRIIVITEGSTYSFGRKGHKAGELYYPTDVKIVGEKIVVADAYNNRVQIFTVGGKFLKALGERDKFKVASGIDADENQIVVTDSENNRVVIYDWDGKIIGVLTRKIEYPIDVFIVGERLMVCNFHIGTISIFKD